jgi:hypothetical protein
VAQLVAREERPNARAEGADVLDPDAAHAAAPATS